MISIFLILFLLIKLCVNKYRFLLLDCILIKALLWKILQLPR